MLIYVVFQTLFLDFELCWIAISRPVEAGKSHIPQKKALLPLFERSFKTGRISAMKCSRQVLQVEVLFQLRGRGYPQNDATPNFFPDSKRTILGFSNKVSFVSKLFLQKW